MAMNEYQCVGCGRSFAARTSNRAEARYCDWRCYAKHRPNPTPETERTCRVCGEVKAIEQFLKSRQMIRFTCLACTNAKQKSGIGRRRSSAKAYGLTLEQYDELAARPCAICGLVPTADKPSFVDHDHVSGRVRAALCGRCNSGLGFFKDRPELLDAAANYLEMTVHRTFTTVE